MSAISTVSTWSRADRSPVRVMMVDDSAVMRAVVERMFDACEDFDLVCKATTTTEAFAFLADNQVDIILLDHEMPGQTGLEALPKIAELGRRAHIVMFSTHCQRGSKTAVAALTLGASDAIAKPSRAQPVELFSETLVTRLRQLAASWRHPGRIDREVVLRASPAGFSLQCIGIGASTGGIHTLGELLSGFTAPPGVPILITQHLPEPFIRYYVQQVSRMIDLPVQIAVEGTILRPDHVYVAPGESSLSCQRFGSVVRAVLLPQRDPATQARPSVNFMFSAMAECYGDGALGIVLTGIGRDGTFGAGRIVDAGGAIVAQDRDSSVVWGMPGSVTRAGFACANLQPDEMPGYIARLAGAES